jgi:hypothetical protein
MLRMRAQLNRRLGNIPDALRDLRGSLIIAYEELAKDSAELRGLVPAAAALIGGESEDGALGVTRYEVIESVCRHRPGAFEPYLARVKGLANLLKSAGQDAESAAWSSAVQAVRARANSGAK